MFSQNCVRNTSSNSPLPVTSSSLYHHLFIHIFLIFVGCLINNIIRENSRNFAPPLDCNRILWIAWGFCGLQGRLRSCNPLQSRHNPHDPATIQYNRDYKKSAISCNPRIPTQSMWITGGLCLCWQKPCRSGQ